MGEINKDIFDVFLEGDFYSKLPKPGLYLQRRKVFGKKATQAACVTTWDESPTSFTTHLSFEGLQQAP